MSWRIHEIHRLWDHVKDTHQILPSCSFTLVNGNGTKRRASGWLPCHFGNIEYNLTLGKTGRIVQILQVRKNGPKKNPKRNQRIENRTHYDRINKNSYTSDGLWALSVAYPVWWLVKQNITEVAEELKQKPEAICLRDSSIFLPNLLFNEKKAIETVQRIHIQLGYPPIDQDAVSQRIAWQKCTRSNTGSMEKPGPHVTHIQKFQDLWASKKDILFIRNIAQTMTPSMCTIIQGSPCPSMIPNNATIVVRSLEDAYKWKCFVDGGKLHIVNMPNINREHLGESMKTVLKELGISDLKILEPNQDVFVAWSHLWGVEQWYALIDRSPTSMTCIGRLDQYPAGRGQIFRDMCQSKTFSTTMAYHHGSSDVVMIDHEVDEQWIQGIVTKHKVVQCFADEPEKWSHVDTNRRMLTRPRRIRTLRSRKRDRDSKCNNFPLYEEKYARHSGYNASVLSVATYQGLPVDGVIFFCSSNTKSFDVHVARTHCRGTLYVVCCTTCLFALQRRPPRRLALNPFK